MKMPFLSEELLIATAAALSRDLRSEGVFAVDHRFKELSEENPTLFEWLSSSINQLDQAALVIPKEFEIEDSVPTDPKRTFVSLTFAKEYIFVTAVQIYKAIKAQMEVDELNAETTTGEK